MLDRRQFTLMSLGAIPFAAPLSAHAADFPTRPLRIVLGYSAGTPADVFVRLVATRLSTRLNQPVVVDNRPGAGGAIAYEHVAKQPPDGYCLGYVASSMMGVKYVMEKPPFDALRDFTWIAPARLTHLAMMVTSKLNVSTPQELAALIKARPGELKFASYGVTSGNNFRMQWLLKSLGLEAVHVPYKEAAQIMPDMMRGDTHFMLDGIPPMQAAIRSGHIRMIAVTGPKRIASHPDVPTLSETMLPGFSYVPSWGFVGSARMPKELVELLNQEINAVLRDPAVIENGQLTFAPIEGGAPAKLEQWLRQSDAEYQEAAKAGVFKTA